MVFYSDIFSILDPVGFIWTVVFQKCIVLFLEGRFSPTTPLVFRYSSTSNPCGFYSARGFLKVTGEVFKGLGF